MNQSSTGGELPLNAEQREAFRERGFFSLGKPFARARARRDRRRVRPPPRARREDRQRGRDALRLRGAAPAPEPGAAALRRLSCAGRAAARAARPRRPALLGPGRGEAARHQFGHAVAPGQRLRRGRARRVRDHNARPRRDDARERLPLDPTREPPPRAERAPRHRRLLPGGLRGARERRRLRARGRRGARVLVAHHASRGAEPDARAGGARG